MAENKERRTVEIVMNGSQPQKTLKGLSQDISILAQNIRKLDPASDAFKQQTAKLKDLRREYGALNKQVFDTASTFDRFKRDALAFGAGGIFASVAGNLTSYLSDGARYIAETSDQLAQIRKTAGLSADQVDALNKSISEIDSRTAKSALRDIAIGLGQMGVEVNKANIESIDKIVVALGDEFKGGAEEITTQLGILRNNLQDFKTGDFAADMLHLGNALNELGAAGLATAPVVTDFSTRMSGVLQQFGVSTGQTLGLAAAMQELGVGVERGSTAVTKLVQKMASNPEVFAKVAGAKTKEEVQQFIDLLNKDAISALMKVAAGAKAAGNSNTEFAAIIKELEASGAGVSEVLGKLAGSQQLVTDKMALASKAVTENNSINQEFALMNDTIAAKVEKLSQRMKKFYDGDFFNRIVTKAVNGAISFVNALEKLGGWIQRNAFWLKGLAAAYAVYYVAMSRAVIMQTTKIALQRAENALVAISVAGIKAVIVAEEVLTGKRKLAAVAQAALNTVMNLNPAVALATAIAGLSIAMGSYIRKMQEAKFEQEALFSAKKLEAQLNLRTETFNAEQKSIIGNIRSGNKEKLKLDQEALEAANGIRMEEIKQLKAAVEEKKRIAEASTRQASVAGVTGEVNKTDAEREKDKQILADAQKNLDDLLAKHQMYAELRDQVGQKLIEIDKKQAESAKELTDKQKQELERQTKLLADFRKSLQDYYDQVEQAKIDVIEEDQARELADLDFKKKLADQKADAELKDLVEQAKKAEQSESIIQDIIRQSAFIKLAIEEKYQEDRSAIIQRNADEKAKLAYDQELKNLNDYIEANKLAYTQLYAANQISKSTFEQAMQDLDIDSKQKLLVLAKKHGVDVRKAEQDIANAVIAINEEKSEALKRQLIQQAEAELRIAELRMQGANQKGGPGDRRKAMDDLYNAEINSLVTRLATEAGITELSEQNILNIKKKYREEFDAIDAQYSEMQMQRNMDIAGMVIEGLSQISNMAFSIRADQLNQELEMATSFYNQESAELQKQKDKKILSETDYNKKKSLLDEQYAKKQRELKRKQAVNDKVAAIFNIALSTAQAVMNALATVPFPANIAFAAMAGAMGAVQLGFAASKPIPAFATGGILPDGPLHRDGGMNIVDRSGRPVANIEGGEPILSRETYKNNKQLVDALLMSQGKSISQLPVFMNRVPSVSYGTVTNAQRTVTMAKGGFLPGSSTSTGVGGQNTDTFGSLNDTMQQMLAMNSALMKKLEEPATAVFDFDYFTRRKALLEQQQLMANPGKTAV